MNDNEYIARTAIELLERKTAVVLATIISLEGSSPRHIGTKMLIGADGKNYGTIGGSLLEATVIKESRLLLSGSGSKLMHFALTGKDANAIGMICGGRAVVLLDYVPATKANLEFFKGWQGAIQRGSKFYFLTHLKEDGNGVNIIGHYILSADGKVTGTGPCSLPDTARLTTELSNLESTAVIQIDDTKIVVDPICKLKSLYCFGAGHVALPTAHIAALVGFRVIILDDRPEYANIERFPDSHSVKVIEEFKRAFSGLEIDSDSFIVIVTRGHQYDREVLEQALQTRAGYIGMISSRKKREAIYNALMAKGVTREQLERVHSPIGIAIGGETPEEIAVSIVAELISERARQPQS